MFEQAVLPSRPAGGRYWTVAAGFTGELLAVGVLLLAPLVWTGFTPRARALNWISLPSPPPPVLKEAPPVRVNPTHPLPPNGGPLVLPVTTPPTPLPVEDPPRAEPATAVDGGVRSASANAVLSLFDPIAHIAPPEHHAQPVTSQPVKSSPAGPRRVSVLHPARLLHRVEPAYPVPARTARISGTVELTGVIATDGRIRELRIVSGHPFLAQAALDAVRQWVYEPTVLNTEPVEVIAPITVYFRLK